MALVFHRRLAKPVWAIAFFTVALAASPSATPFLMPTTLLVLAVVGIALVVFTMPATIPWLHASRSLVRVLPSRQGDRTTAGNSMAAGTSVHAFDEPNRRMNDALDFARMDDDGGWQMLRPPA